MARQDSHQKEIVGRVMHEFKHGELESHGEPVRNPKQAVAIALNEAGTSNEQSPQQNRASRARTEARERHGETAQQQKEHTGPNATRAALYAEARRRDIPGRSHMTKDELARALSK